jgi:hypothetical protein
MNLAQWLGGGSVNGRRCEDFHFYYSEIAAFGPQSQTWTCCGQFLVVSFDSTIKIASMGPTKGATTCLVRRKRFLMALWRSAASLILVAVFGGRRDGPTRALSGCDDDIEYCGSYYVYGG